MIEIPKWFAIFSITLYALTIVGSFVLLSISRYPRAQSKSAWEDSFSLAVSTALLCLWTYWLMR